MTGFDDAALRFIILSANASQQVFQFEFLPFPNDDSFTAQLQGSTALNRASVEAQMMKFLIRYQLWLEERIEAYRLIDDPPNHLLVITQASFEDNYYHTSNRHVTILALGNWKRSMAPPSILEFIRTLALRDAVWSVCPEIHSSHMGTRGCLFDFNATLSDLKQMVFVGIICELCKEKLRDNGHTAVASEVGHLLSRQWLGESSDPASPAGISSKLGHDLFITKGLQPSFVESVRTGLVQEGVKQILGVVAGLALAALIILLGFSAAGGTESTEPVPGDSPRAPTPTVSTHTPTSGATSP
jgi:hypothetical protein